MQSMQLQWCLYVYSYRIHVDIYVFESLHYSYINFSNSYTIVTLLLIWLVVVGVAWCLSCCKMWSCFFDISLTLFVSLRATLFAIHATPETRAEGSREIIKSGTVLIAEPLPISREYRNTIAIQCTYSMTNQKGMKNTTKNWILLICCFCWLCGCWILLISCFCWLCGCWILLISCFCWLCGCWLW